MVPFPMTLKEHRNVSYLYGDDSVVVGLKRENVRLARDDRWECKLHRDVGIDRADVLVAVESIQLKSDVDVNTNTSV